MSAENGEKGKPSTLLTLGASSQLRDCALTAASSRFAVTRLALARHEFPTISTKISRIGRQEYAEYSNSRAAQSIDIPF